MNIELIDKWLENKYGVSYTRLEELHDFVVEQDLKHREQAEKEIERLNNIINELERYLIEDNYKNEEVWCISTQQVLNKLKELKESGNNE